MAGRQAGGRRTRLIFHPIHLGYVVLHVATVLAAATLPSLTQVGVFIVASWSLFMVVRLLFVGPITEVDTVFVLWLAAAQNVLIGPLVEYLSADRVRVLIGINFMVGAMWVVALGLQRVRAISRVRTVWIGLSLPAMSMMIVSSIAIFGFNGLAAVASIRNILTPAIFFVAGWLVAWRRFETPPSQRFMRAVVWLGVIVVLLGLVERFMVPHVWEALNIGDLWTKKGLTNVTPSSTPRNWWSAEQIGGEPVRRLVSTFADPVNLGAFLLLSMICAYSLKRPFVALFSAVGILLTVSKGGALGCLVFAVVYAYYRWSRLGFLATGLAASVSGAAFVAYSARYATRSLFAHLGGAASAMITLPAYPLGRGVGQAGTMAMQFAELSDSQIQESGLGLVVGQLGIPGLLIFVCFLYFVYAGVLRTRDIRERIVAVTLFWSITLNIIFNEVALSPNSNAGYFLLLGMIAAQVGRSEPTRDGPPRLSNERVNLAARSVERDVPCLEWDP